MAKAETANKEPLEKQLWKAADKLRKNIDVAEYKHVVLGLIFLKYISDSLKEHFPANLGDLMDLIGDITLGGLEPAIISVPSTEELCSMSEKMTPLLDKQFTIAKDLADINFLAGLGPGSYFEPNPKQRKNLEKLRDTLLSKLMSAEIRVTL
jgi:type I restriction-modification system DNA methylase subunit